MLYANIWKDLFFEGLFIPGTDCGTRILSTALPLIREIPGYSCEGRPVPEACYKMVRSFTRFDFKWYGFLVFPLFMGAGLQKRTNKPSHAPGIGGTEVIDSHQPKSYFWVVIVSTTGSHLIFEDREIQLSEKNQNCWPSLHKHPIN
jgi:hypothetical protein